MNYIVVEKNNSAHYKMLNKLMFEYVAETDIHKGIATSKDIIQKITISMIDKLDENRILIIATYGNENIGFCYAKLDKEGDKGLIRPNWGYIMELYVSPVKRRNGIAREMVNLCEKFFVSKGADSVWLTADAVTGIPFWLACGYGWSNETSLENNQKIFIKEHINESHSF